MREMNVAASVEPDTNEKIIFWPRELPAPEADLIGEYTVEAASRRLPAALADGNELWNRCYADLMAQVRRQLEQEVLRIGGNYAQMVGETVGSTHDESANEIWLYGRFTYSLYRRAVVHRRHLDHC